jgi:hypothetical protein
VAARVSGEVRSEVELEELERRMLERLPRLQRVSGLKQKVHGRDDATGDVCGIYFFESNGALAAFRDSELARTISKTHDASNSRIEAFSVLYSLWPDEGPLAEADMPGA